MILSAKQGSDEYLEGHVVAPVSVCVYNHYDV